MSRFWASNSWLMGNKKLEICEDSKAASTYHKKKAGERLHRICCSSWMPPSDLPSCGVSWDATGQRRGNQGIDRFAERAADTQQYSSVWGGSKPLAFGCFSCVSKCTTPVACCCDEHKHVPGTYAGMRYVPPAPKSSIHMGSLWPLQ